MLGFLRGSRQSAHRFCQQNLSAYIDGQLKERDLNRIRQHLQQCQACRWELQTLQNTVSLVRSLPQVRAPRSFRIPDTAPAPAVPVWMRPWAYGAMRAATAAAAALLVVVLAGNALALPATMRAAAPMLAAALPAEQSAKSAAEPTGAVPQAEAATAPTAEPMPGQLGGPDWSVPPGLSAATAAPLPTLPLWGLGGGGPEATPLPPAEATRAAQAPLGMGAGPTPDGAKPTRGGTAGGGCQGECGPGTTRTPGFAAAGQPGPTASLTYTSTVPAVAIGELTPQVAATREVSAPTLPSPSLDGYVTLEPTGTVAAELGGALPEPSPTAEAAAGTAPASVPATMAPEPSPISTATNVPAPLAAGQVAEGNGATPEPTAEGYHSINLARGLEAPAVLRMREQLAYYPLRQWALVSAALLAVLTGATAWLRATRQRWPR